MVVVRLRRRFGFDEQACGARGVASREGAAGGVIVSAMMPACFLAASRNVSSVAPRSTAIADRTTTNSNAPIHRATVLRFVRMGGCRTTRGSGRLRVGRFVAAMSAAGRRGGGRSMLCPPDPARHRRRANGRRRGDGRIGDARHDRGRFSDERRWSGANSRAGRRRQCMTARRRFRSPRRRPAVLMRWMRRLLLKHVLAGDRNVHEDRSNFGKAFAA